MIQCQCGHSIEEHSIEEHSITAYDRVKCQVELCSCLKFTRVNKPQTFRVKFPARFSDYRMFLDEHFKKQEPPLGA